MIGVLPPQGGTIKLLVDLLNINKAEDEQKTLLEELTDSVIAVEHRLPTIHMGQIPQDGKNEQYVALFFNF